MKHLTLLLCLAWLSPLMNDGAILHADDRKKSPEGEVDPSPWDKLVLGDVNKDGSVTISDVSALVRIILGGDATDLDLQSADVNEDGNVTVADVSALVSLILAQ